MSKVEYNVFWLLIGLEDFMLSVLSLVEIRQAIRASAKPNILNWKLQEYEKTRQIILIL